MRGPRPASRPWSSGTGRWCCAVCRQVLGDPHDAEDAFQATFLVLARRAGSVRRRDSVASWLHGIARRVAMHARADAARRRRHERQGAAMRDVETRDEADIEGWPELHEELARLPSTYRESVVLCYMEGLTTAAAARRLGCAQGTVLARLSRARARLRRRLIGRGVVPSAGLLMAGLSAGRRAGRGPGRAVSIGHHGRDEDRGGQDGGRGGPVVRRCPRRRSAEHAVPFQAQGDAGDRRGFRRGRHRDRDARPSAGRGPAASRAGRPRRARRRPAAGEGADAPRSSSSGPPTCRANSVSSAFMGIAAIDPETGNGGRSTRG